MIIIKNSIMINIFKKTKFLKLIKNYNKKCEICNNVPDWDFW